MKTGILSLLLVLPLLAQADEAPTFGVAFGHVLEHRLHVGFFQDAPYDPADYPFSNATAPMWNAIGAMSNHVEEAIAMIPSVVTNDLQRDLFLHMAGHAGTNAFLRVWEGLLDIAETNPIVVLPELVDSFNSGATTPMEGYVVFHYDMPEIQSLLVRTRNLFSTNSAARVRYDETISGATREAALSYAAESGAGLPFGAGQDP